MEDKTTVNIIAWIFLICSMFTSYGVFIICASIWFCTYYIIKAIEKNDRNNN